MASMENRLLQYGAKEYFFKAVVCHFCTDPDKARVRIVFSTPSVIVSALIVSDGEVY